MRCMTSFNVSVWKTKHKQWSLSRIWNFREGNEFQMPCELLVWSDEWRWRNIGFSKHDFRCPFCIFRHVCRSSSECSNILFQYCLCNYFCLHALLAPLQSFTKVVIKLLGLHSIRDSISLSICIYYDKNQKGMPSGSYMIHCCTGWKKLNSFCGMAPLILSPGTDLLILKSQTGPIHNATLGRWGLSFHCNEKAIYWDDSCWGSICFPSSGVSAITLTNSPCILSPQTHFPLPWHAPNLERS